MPGVLQKLRYRFQPTPTMLPQLTYAAIDPTTPPELGARPFFRFREGTSRNFEFPDRSQSLDPSCLAEKNHDFFVGLAAL